MKLSCSDGMVPGKTLTEKALNLKNWGYDAIAIFTEYQKWNSESLTELLSIKEKTGVVPCEFVFMDPTYGHLMDPDKNTKMHAVAMYKEAIKICKQIGAITEMEFAYGAQDPLPLFDPYQKMSPDEEKEFLEVLMELGGEAEGSLAQVLIEPLNRYETKYLTRMQDCLEILKKVNLSNTGILADFFHLSIEEADLPASILSAQGYIKHVHLGDNNRLLPGYGHTDWHACFNALKDIGFVGYVNLECGIPGKPEELLPRTAEYLKKLIS